MKLILDIEEETLNNMQGYCNQKEMTMNELVESLFNQFVQEPASAIDKIYEKDGNLDKLEEFQKYMHHYLNEAIIDIENDAKSDEAYETDLPMAEVFKSLNREYIYDSRIMVGLYKVFRDEME